MTVGRMLAMHGFNRLFEALVFDELTTLAVNIFPVDPQRLSTDALVRRLLYDFDFF